jgi:uncharacterized protein (TIGR00304 family)
MDRGSGLLALSSLMVLSGLGLLVLAGLRGDAELNLVIIIPVITGTGGVFAGGTLLFVLGLMLLMVAWGLRSAIAYDGGHPSQPATSSPEDRGPAPPRGRPAAGSGVEFGGVVFIGPIPITFGSSPRMGRLMLVATIVIAVLMIAFILGLLL